MQARNPAGRPGQRGFPARDDRRRGQERSGLEKQWDRGHNVSTEDLRVVLPCYRTFSDQLLKL